VHKPRRLIIGIGNPSRGDDALGPALVERLANAGIPDTEWLTDYQLQVEYLLDLHERELIIFIDASVSAPPPFTFTPIQAREDDSYSSHALSPEALLMAYQRHYQQPAPPAYVLAIRGYRFELGEGLSPEAEGHLAEADFTLRELLCSGNSDDQVLHCDTAKRA